MEILYLFIGLALGFVIAFLINRNKISGIDKEKSIINERLIKTEEDKQKLTTDLEKERNNSLELSNRMAKAEVEFINIREKLNSQKQEYEDLQKKFTTEFENIANKILKQNSQEFTSVNQKNIGDLLNPLKEKIEKFEKKVEDTYMKGVHDQTDLKAELKKLYELNNKISEEANNLTKALKGDVKKQGNWGEIILERILERSGLTKGQEYETQVSFLNENGDRVQPDVIIHLPENKHIIVDSKVSLIAYEKFVNATVEEDRQRFAKEHILSIRTHIKLLSDKNYQLAGNIHTPDFVLLFIPIESSFGVAVQTDIELFNYAWDNKIVIVSPSTLLATLKTIESIWKQEKQSKNVMEIARQGGALYDKFESFIKDLEKLGTQISSVQNTYDDAFKKISSGKGNLIGQVDKLRILGAKTTKKLPDKYLDNNNIILPDEN